MAAYAEHLDTGLDVAAFVDRFTRPALDELPDPWCRVLKAGRRTRYCLPCGRAVLEYQARFVMLAGINEGVVDVHYEYECDTCGASSSGNYGTDWIV